ncbi:metalloregulator ArsR/SmtB family transcription factor [Crenobacter sp. SG2303]|uniref:Metalloregulator ArsR/SmtB family transcription factor n=1 Tax=Crenobacter oryzisoli TaxID=3056844 RepID=A0ABT7XLC0_9NEIS|nr:metalloregulator ArsR/SmtB family transcription factor [Crenobacter sp. SG2303]MDN0074576.1 metalloregulator ArsR/SmtB family transcription factor [Crenobacter sp. SG2303]
MESKTAVTLLAALAQDTRLAIYRLLVQQGPTGMSVGQISEALGVVGATLSFHLKELSHAGLVLSRQEGRFIYYAANYAEMNALLGFLTENCCRGEPCEPASSSISCDGTCR